MLAKIGMLLLVAGLVLGAVRLVSFVRGRTGGAGRRSRPERARTLAPCPRCGTYVPDGDCDCGRRDAS